MTFILKQVFGLLKLLNSETGENQIAMGLALGLILGFSPWFSLQTLVLFGLVLIFRIQIGALFISAFVFKFVAYLLDPLADALGRRVLEAPSLRGLFVELYNLPIIPLSRFNNSLVMGSGILGFTLAIPSFFLFKFLIQRYRLAIVTKIKRTWLWRTLQATALFRLYATYNQLTG
jgi:uncharacterized protein (TIGR03546 family)